MYALGASLRPIAVAPMPCQRALSPRSNPLFPLVPDSDIETMDSGPNARLKNGLKEKRNPIVVISQLHLMPDGEKEYDLVPGGPLCW